MNIFVKKYFLYEFRLKRWSIKCSDCFSLDIDYSRAKVCTLGVNVIEKEAVLIKGSLHLCRNCAWRSPKL